ncbi:hypothetical protein Tco_1265007 [Tanacetum coccineum]
MEELRISFQAWSDNIRQKKEQEEKQIAEEQVAKARYWKIPICNDDDDEDDTIAITPVLPTMEPDNSLSMGDEHLRNKLPKKSEFNPIHNEDLNSTLKNDRFDTESYLLESLLNHDTLMASSPKIDSLFDEFTGELITIPPRIVNREHEEYISLIEREEIDIFPGPDDSIPPGIESDDYDSEGDDNSTSLPEFKSFHIDYPDLGDSTIDVVEDIPVDVPKFFFIILYFIFMPSHPTPSYGCSTSYLSIIDLGSDLDVSSPFGDRNKIYDPGICIEVESMRFLATLSPMIDTLLPFSSENEDKVFNHGVLASKEKSPPSSSHRGFKASKLFHHKSPMLIHVCCEEARLYLSRVLWFCCMSMISPDYEASRARGFVLRSLELQHPQLHYENPISNLID